MTINVLQFHYAGEKNPSSLAYPTQMWIPDTFPVAQFQISDRRGQNLFLTADKFVYKTNSFSCLCFSNKFLLWSLFDWLGSERENMRQQRRTSQEIEKVSKLCPSTCASPKLPQGINPATSKEELHSILVFSKHKICYNTSTLECRKVRTHTYSS